MIKIIILYFICLLCLLGGMGVGLLLAQHSNRKNGGKKKRKVRLLQPPKPVEHKSELDKIDKNNSFSEFNCLIDGEDEKEHINEKMKEQDAKYSKMVQKKEKAVD